MKKFAHVTFLFIVVYSGLAYWYVTTGNSIARRQIDHGYLGIFKPAGGFFAVMLDPACSYAVAAMCILLIVKEFYIKSMKRRFAFNAAGFLVVYLFIGFLQYWTWHRT